MLPDGERIVQYDSLRAVPHSPGPSHRSAVGCEVSYGDLQQSALASPVLTDDSYQRPGGYLEVDVAQDLPAAVRLAYSADPKPWPVTRRCHLHISPS